MWIYWRQCKAFLWDLHEEMAQPNGSQPKLGMAIPKARLDPIQHMHLLIKGHSCVFPKHERGSWGCLLHNVAQNSGWDRLLVVFSVIVTSGQVPTWQLSDVFSARWYHPAFHKQGELSHNLKASSAPNLGEKDWLSQLLWREQEDTW